MRTRCEAISSISVESSLFWIPKHSLRVPSTSETDRSPASASGCLDGCAPVICRMSPWHMLSAYSYIPGHFFLIFCIEQCLINEPPPQSILQYIMTCYPDPIDSTLHSVHGTFLDSLLAIQSLYGNARLPFFSLATLHTAAQSRSSRVCKNNTLLELL